MNISKYNLERFTTPNTILPSGNYTAELNMTQIVMAKEDHEILRLTWLIRDGIYSGKYFHSFFNMSNPGSIHVFYKMVRNMGFIPENIKNTIELHGAECVLIITQFNHPLHGSSNKVEKYLPVLKTTKS